MAMTSALALAWVAGVALGAVFFGGLWWTIEKGLSSRRPALWFALSWLGRTAITVAGLYLVAGGDWQRLAACLVGFVMVRMAVIHRVRAAQARPAGPPARADIHPPQEAHRAP